jgi:hypothetical protein
VSNRGIFYRKDADCGIASSECEHNHQMAVGTTGSSRVDSLKCLLKPSTLNFYLIQIVTLNN